VFWDVMKRKFVVSCGYFGTTYQSGFPEKSVTTNLRCITSQKSEDLKTIFCVKIKATRKTNEYITFIKISVTLMQLLLHVETEFASELLAVG
jgi:hypothetical protein